MIHAHHNKCDLFLEQQLKVDWNTALSTHVLFSHVLVFGMESTDYRWILVISASIGNEVSGTKVGGRNNQFYGCNQCKIRESYETFTV